MPEDASARRWLGSNVQTRKLACVSRNAIVPTTGLSSVTMTTNRSTPSEV
jgi:hypothetical protein